MGIGAAAVVPPGEDPGCGGGDTHVEGGRQISVWKMQCREIYRKELCSCGAMSGREVKLFGVGVEPLDH